MISLSHSLDPKSDWALCVFDPNLKCPQKTFWIGLTSPRLKSFLLKLFAKWHNFGLIQTDDKSNVTKMIISVFDRVEYIAGKGENDDYQHSSFSHNVFKRLFLLGVIKTQGCVVKG